MLLAAATVQQAGLTFVRFGLPAVAPFVRDGLGLSVAQVGIVLGAFDLGAVAVYYVTGLATDRYGERRVMVAGALATGLIVAMAGATRGLWQLALVLALAGVGFPSSQVAGSHAVMGWFPERQRGLAMGVRQAGLPIGGLLGALVLPWVAQRWGWESALAVAGVGATISGLVALAVIRDPAQDASAAAQRRARWDWIQAPKEFIQSRALVMTTASACLLAVAQFSLTGYLPLFMVDAMGWERGAAARLLLAVHAGGIAGRLVWGWLSDRGFSGERSAPLAGAALAGAACILAVGWLGVAPSRPEVWAVFIVGGCTGLTALGWNGLYVTLLSELAGRRAPAMLGLSMSALYVWTMLAPPVFGQLVERTGNYGVAWFSLAAAPLGAAFVSWRLRTRVLARMGGPHHALGAATAGKRR